VQSTLLGINEYGALQAHRVYCVKAGFMTLCSPHTIEHRLHV